MNFDLNSIIVNGVGLGALILGLTQFFKELLKWEGNRVRVLSVGLGVVVLGLWEARLYIGSDLYQQIYGSVVVVLAGALSAGGYYQLLGSVVDRLRGGKDNEPRAIG